MAGLTIGKLAAAAGVSVETVRFYQRRGLLTQPERPGAGFREYSEADQDRLAFIRRAQRLGFTLAEVRDLIGPAEARSAGDIVAAAAAKLEAVDAQLAELARLQGRLRRLVRVCEDGNGDDCVALHLGADHSIADHLIADHLIADHLIADHPAADHAGGDRLAAAPPGATSPGAGPAAAAGRTAARA